MSDPSDPVQAITNATAAILAIHSDDSLVWSDDVGERLRVVVAARELLAAARDMTNYCEVDAIAVVPKRYETDGGVWETKSGNRRVIRDHSSVMSALAYGISDSWVDDQLTADLIEAVDKCLPAACSWKVTELRERGVDPDDFSTWETGKKTLRFTPVDEGQAMMDAWEKENQ